MASPHIEKITASQINLHDVDRITTQLMCLNGRWQRRFHITAGTHELTIVLFQGESDDASLEFIERGCEYVHVEDYEARVDRSDKPFGESPSAEYGSKP